MCSHSFSAIYGSAVQLTQNQLRALREIDNCLLFNQLQLSATICGESVAVWKFPRWQTVSVYSWAVCAVKTTHR